MENYQENASDFRALIPQLLQDGIAVRIVSTKRLNASCAQKRGDIGETSKNLYTRVEEHIP